MRPTLLAMLAILFVVSQAVTRFAFGRSFAGGLAGFVTRAEMDRFIRDQGLVVVEGATRRASYEVICQRLAI